MKWRRLILGSVCIISIYIMLSGLRNFSALQTKKLNLPKVSKTEKEPLFRSTGRISTGNIGNTSSTKLDDGKVHVLIVTRWRYGSTFTGEIFNNNPDFVYFYEPLRGKMYQDQEINNLIHQDQINMLHDILKCEFTDKNYTWWNPEDTKMNCACSMKFGPSVLCAISYKPADKPGKVRDAMTGKFIYDRRIKGRSTQQYFSASFSKTSRSSMVEDICRSGKHVAIKTVRVPDLKYLKNIIMDESLNVKVIQLVRDLRGVYLSREEWDGGCDMQLSECDELKNNLNYWIDPPSWLKNRYMLLRYEDLADDPVDMVQIIYDFLGLPAPETVKTWLRLNTLKMTSSSKSAYSWRTQIRYPVMRQVQSYCMDTLLMAGYNPIESPKDLTNLEVPSIKKYSYPLLPNVTSGIQSRNKARKDRF